MKEKAVLFPIPGHILHITIESSRDYQLRLEAEAAALAAGTGGGCAGDV